jgi:hypothetical protein
MADTLTLHPRVIVALLGWILRGCECRRANVNASFSSWYGMPTHASKSLLTGVLKQRMVLAASSSAIGMGTPKFPELAPCRLAQCRQIRRVG